MRSVWVRRSMMVLGTVSFGLAAQAAHADSLAGAAGGAASMPTEMLHESHASPEELHRQRMQMMRDMARLEEMARQDQRYYSGVPLADSVMRAPAAPAKR